MGSQRGQGAGRVLGTTASHSWLGAGQAPRQGRSPHLRGGRRQGRGAPSPLWAGTATLNPTEETAVNGAGPGGGGEGGRSRAGLWARVPTPGSAHTDAGDGTGQAPTAGRSTTLLEKHKLFCADRARLRDVAVSGDRHAGQGRREAGQRQQRERGFTAGLSALFELSSRAMYDLIKNRINTCLRHPGAGAAGGLGRLSGRLRLRSRSRGSCAGARRRALRRRCGACLKLSLPLARSLPLPHLCAHARSLPK